MTSEQLSEIEARLRAHVRLAAAEITALKAIHVSPGKAIHELIKRSYE